ncbi:hypothetical protein, partial [Sandaracinobacteroides hominis]|uniref:hypothetical protein n=1 Tax=Sandaracinobacteroides hominis TaxID=2780086 RepID=UPI001A9C8139
VRPPHRLEAHPHQIRPLRAHLLLSHLHRRNRHLPDQSMSPEPSILELHIQLYQTNLAIMQSHKKIVKCELLSSSLFSASYSDIFPINPHQVWRLLTSATLAIKA